MTQRAVYGHGTVITIDGLPVANTTDIELDLGGVTMIDVTSHSSPIRMREYIPGMREQGKLTFGVYWDPGDASHQALETAYLANSEVSVTVTFPDLGAKTFSFQALVSLGAIAAPHDGPMTIKPVTLTISGAVT